MMMMMTAIPAADWEAARVSSSLYSKFSADDQNNFNLWSIQTKGLSFDQCEWKIYLLINTIKITFVQCYRQNYNLINMIDFLIFPLYYLAGWPPLYCQSTANCSSWLWSDDFLDHQNMIIDQMHKWLHQIIITPDICQFWYIATLLRPVKSTPKRAQIRNKIAKISQNGPKLAKILRALW